MVRHGDTVQERSGVALSFCGRRTYDQLSTIQANYLRLETLNAANDNINNATAKLPIFRYYNIQEDVIH
ncbi:MAG: Tn3 family transposase, partial [Pseudomonas sp.]